MYCVDKMFCSRGMALLPAMMISSFSTKNTPMVFDMTRNGTVYEPLARSDDYVPKLEQLSLTVLGSRLDRILPEEVRNH